MVPSVINTSPKIGHEAEVEMQEFRNTRHEDQGASRISVNSGSND